MSNESLKQILSQAAADRKNQNQEKVETFQFLVFGLDNEEYGLNLNELSEIIMIPEITPIPNSPDFIKGVLNLRGQIVVVIDLEKRFGLVHEKESKPKHIIIVQMYETFFGIIVDSVREVINAPIDKIRVTPGLLSAKIHAEYINGVLVLDNAGVEIKETKNTSKKRGIYRILQR